MQVAPLGSGGGGGLLYQYGGGRGEGGGGGCCQYGGGKGEGGGGGISHHGGGGDGVTGALGGGGKATPVADESNQGGFGSGPMLRGILAKTVAPVLSTISMSKATYALGGAKKTG